MIKDGLDGMIQSSDMMIGKLYHGYKLDSIEASILKNRIILVMSMQIRKEEP